MYSLRDAIEGLSRNITGQWEQQQNILAALEQINYELARLNERLEKTDGHTIDQRA
jgi:hypothetical protein